MYELSSTYVGWSGVLDAFMVHALGLKNDDFRLLAYKNTTWPVLPLQSHATYHKSTYQQRTHVIFWVFDAKSEASPKQNVPIKANFMALSKAV